MERYSKLIIEAKYGNYIDLCEIEIFSSNIAHSKLTISKYSSNGELDRLTDGNEINRVTLRLGQDYWVAINLLAYYNVFGLDFRLMPTYLHQFKSFYVELTNENPAVQYNPTKYSYCGEKDGNNPNGSDMFDTILCKRGGVKGQFVVLRSNSSNMNVVVSEIEIFGNYLKDLEKRSKNILSNKPSWTSSYYRQFTLAHLATTGDRNGIFHTKKEDHPWIWIDMLGMYKLFPMAILNREDQYVLRINTIRGVVSEYQSFNVEQAHLHSKICFINDKQFLRGEYAIWDCQQPLPICRYVIFYLSITQYLHFEFVEAYGEEIINANFTLLPLINVHRTESSSLKIYDQIVADQFPIKIIDGSSINSRHQDHYLSCSGTLTNANQEGRIIFSMDNYYMVVEIVVLLPSILVQETFEDVQVAVENFNIELQRQICSLKNDAITEEHLLYNCHFIGDRISLNKINGLKFYLAQVQGHFAHPKKKTAAVLYLGGSFLTDRMRFDLFGKSNHWFIDGTFKIVKDPFYQLVSIHSHVKKNGAMKHVPLTFIFITLKQKKYYKKAFKSIRNLTFMSQPEKTTMDFEMSLWKAVSKIYAEAKIHGCLPLHSSNL
ncbi:DgyrCDS14503 [Dimorphilus gyrociliatus]|uniref:DgyrCDS14503 n=1 Tax=Dimorphilus gyrociliatus TaxID=2664684 RepID=A0A7I8WDT6_9ANNE|nr:DgyrCDS14503 [Dimorphilus gyrociliatus]